MSSSVRPMRQIQCWSPVPSRNWQLMWCLSFSLQLWNVIVNALSHVLIGLDFWRVGLSVSAYCLGELVAAKTGIGAGAAR